MERQAGEDSPRTQTEPTEKGRDQKERTDKPTSDNVDTELSSFACPGIIPIDDKNRQGERLRKSRKQGRAEETERGFREGDRAADRKANLR